MSPARSRSTALAASLSHAATVSVILALTLAPVEAAGAVAAPIVCDQVLLTLDGRHLILAPGCRRHEVVDLATGRLLPRGGKRTEIRGQTAMPVTSVSLDPGVSEPIREHLTRATGTAAAPHTFRAYRLPHNDWVVQFVAGVERDEERRLRGAFIGRLRYASYETFVAEYHFRVGLSAHLAGDLQAARRSYESAIASDPLHVETAWNLVRVLAQQGEIEAALGLLTTVIAFWPERHTEALRDEEMAPLRANPRFVALVDSRPVIVRDESFEDIARPLPPVFALADSRRHRVHQAVKRREVDSAHYDYDAAEVARLIPSFGDFLRHGDLRYNPKSKRWGLDGWVARSINWRGFWNVVGFKRSRFKVIGPEDRGYDTQLELRRIYEALRAAEEVTIRWVSTEELTGRRKKIGPEVHAIVLTPLPEELERRVKGPDSARVRALMQ